VPGDRDDFQNVELLFQTDATDRSRRFYRHNYQIISLEKFLGYFPSLCQTVSRFNVKQAQNIHISNETADLKCNVTVCIADGAQQKVEARRHCFLTSSCHLQPFFKPVLSAIKNEVYAACGPRAGGLLPLV
jgi:hypothetical protein